MPRDRRSRVIITTTKARRIAANCEAAVRLPRPYQVRKIPVLKVSTARYWTAPKSPNVSIIARTIPATMAGRAKGTAIFMNIFHGLEPKLRPTSKTHMLHTLPIKK